MKVTIFAGKGGVGKSTCAGAFALRKAKNNSVLAIDYDAGHSLDKVLALGGSPPIPNVASETDVKNLSLGVVVPYNFVPISVVKRRIEEGDASWNINKYLDQFEGEYGLLPLCDMVTTFYGIPTSITDVSHFATLSHLYHEARAQRVEDIVIDIEPTAGFFRLVSSIGAITRSMKNLKDKNWKTKVAMWGMPDIKAFTEGEFIQNCDEYSSRIQNLVDTFKESEFYVIGIPEESPVMQMRTLGATIERGLRCRIPAYIINNVRGEPHEEEQLKYINRFLKDKTIIQIPRDSRLCATDKGRRRDALYEVGEKIVEAP